MMTINRLLVPLMQPASSQTLILRLQTTERRGKANAGGW